jgi:hypothetical protein
MIPDYIKNIVDSFSESNQVQRLKLVYEQETYYDKFYSVEHPTRLFYKNQYNIEDIVDRINIKDKNLILDYCFYDNGIYLRCEKKQKYYNFNEMLTKFSSYNNFFDYCIEQINHDLEAYYPFTLSDYNNGNTFIQKDLSWINVDLDEFFDMHEVVPTFDYRPYIDNYNQIKASHWPVLTDIDSWKQLPSSIKQECCNIYNFSLETDYDKFTKIKETYLFDYRLKLSQKILRLTGAPIDHYELLVEKMQNKLQILE